VQDAPCRAAPKSHYATTPIHVTESVDRPLSDVSEFEKAEILESTRRQVESEHAQMKTCPKCGSQETSFDSQTMTLTGVLGDVVRYRCQACDHHYERFFPFRAGYVPGEIHDVFKLGK